VTDSNSRIGKETALDLASMGATLVKVLIFNNGRAEAIGGQPVPDHVLECILRGYEPHLRGIKNPQDMREVEFVLTEANQARGMRIVIADYRKR